MRTVQSLVLVVTLTALSAGLQAAPVKPEEGRPPVAKDARYHFQVLEARVKFDVRKKTLEEVVEQLRKDHNANVTIDKDVLKSLNLDDGRLIFDFSNDDIKLGAALHQVLSPSGLITVVLGDRIVITAPAMAPALKLNQPVNASFEKTPLGEALERLSRTYGVPIVVPPRVKQATTPVSLSFDRTPFLAAVRALCDAAGVPMWELNEVVTIGPSLQNDRRLRFLTKALNNPIAEIDKGEVALPFLLDTLGALASDPGAARDASLRATTTINMTSFKDRTTGDDVPFDPERSQIKFHSKYIGVSYRTILKIVCDQLDCVPMVRNDFIELVHRRVACEELKIKVADGEPFPELVSRFFDEVPLEDAFAQVADGYNANIVLCPSLKGAKLPTLNTKLINVPLDAAIDILAAAGDLRVVRRANVY